MTRLLAPLLAALLLLPAVALAQAPQQLVPQRDIAPPPGGNVPGDAQTVAAVEAYLDGIRTLKARFTQQSGRSVLRGDFMLSRPGKLRFQYDAPSRDFIVADGSYIRFWDDQMQEESRQGIGSSLADFLLRPRISLRGEVTVTDVARSGGMLSLTLVETAEPEEGALTLYLSESPLELRSWRVMDGEGRRTEVVLADIRTGIALDSDLFYFRKPQPDRTRR